MRLLIYAYSHGTVTLICRPSLEHEEIRGAASRGSYLVEDTFAARNTVYSSLLPLRQLRNMPIPAGLGALDEFHEQGREDASFNCLMRPQSDV